MGRLRRQLRARTASVIPIRFPLERIEHEIRGPHLGQPGIGGLGTGKGSVFGEFVDWLAAADAEILAALPAHLDARTDVSQHPYEIREVRQFDQCIAIYVPQEEIAVVLVLQPEQFGRKRR
jgi:hypothetical protein